jgi:hypothetical protein
VKRLAVRNLDDEVQYYTTAINAGGRYFYCKDDAAVESTDYEYYRVTHNVLPLLRETILAADTQP